MPRARAAPEQQDTPERTPINHVAAAVGIAGLGALLTAGAPLFGLVAPQRPPAFTSWPILLVLAVLPPLLAGTFVRGKRIGSAVGVLVGPALLAPGRLVLDAQLLDDAGLAARPALLHPHDLEPLAPSTGLWVLLAGHAVTGIAGLVAVRGGGLLPDPLPGSEFDADSADQREIEPVTEEGTGTRRQGLLAAVLFVTVSAAAGLLMPRFVSEDPYLLPQAAVDSPTLVLLGSLLIAIGVPTAGGLFVSSADPGFARGGLLGLATAVAGIAVPPLLAATLLDRLHYGWGAVLALSAALVLAGLSVPAGRVTPSLRTGAQVTEVRLPALARLLPVAGGLGVLTGVLAMAGAGLPQLNMPPGVGEIMPYAVPMLLPSGVMVTVVGAAMLVPRIAARVRPALPVVCAVLPLVGVATLDTVLTATQASGAQVGIGAWVTGLAVLSAGAAALVAGVAGGIERDDVDLTELSMHRVVAWLSVPAALSAFGAFSLPVVTAPDYVPPGVFTDFSTTSWGLVVALLSVVATVALAPFCRPSRAVALLSGAVLVVLVRVLAFPLTAERAADSGPGWGLWFGLVCLAVLVGAAAVSARAASDHEK
ncbi:hypothetical protein [Haloactinomyces albus]|uniref:Uncharacterized membrane protein YhaH (DUF805 family) n=1 Tax=Haloactinomyces albus TaxID=1352928 RepID=A0AAE3ZCV9_9ACTN|nr:hypothetical protein [Haloactinomyces albus]MDR7302586.1 uncharacterized membrane protein YhaH (DUF805 family) [Haloactinomyces albus]